MFRKSKPVSTPTRIFVLCTGRCGSMTLSRATAHLDNYTSDHEALTHLTGPERFNIPDHHIAIDNRLAWLLGRLEREWGDNAAYIHLTRAPEATAQSFAKRANQGILKAYRNDILARSKQRAPKTKLIEYCRDYVDTVTQNIDLFLRDKTHKMDMTLENIGPDFDRMCDWIGATGDLDAARAELRVQHNATSASKPRKPAKKGTP